MTADKSAGGPRWFTMSQFPGYFDSPAPSTHVRVDFGARSRQSPQRSVNEDHYLIVRLARAQETLLTSLPDGEMPNRFDEFAYGMVIADGVGQAGEAASRLAVSTLAHLAVYFGKWNVRIDEPIAEEVMDRAERFYKNVDSTLVQAGRRTPLGLRSTLTAVYTAGNELFFAHVGDSRAYLFRDNELMQLTHDHHSGHSLIGSPGVDIADRSRDLHQALASTLGRTGVGGPRIDIERCGLLDGDAVLLCTNGLTNAVDDARIADALRQGGTADDRCRALINLAISQQGDDDVSALVAQYSIPE